MYDDTDRPFVLWRLEDVAGVSGTGLVAHGLRHPDGTASVWWLGDHATRTAHPSMRSVIDIHCHGGRTKVLWSERFGDEWTVPFGDGFFAWVTEPAHTPMSEPGWVFMASRTTTPRWNGAAFNTFVPHLVEGDHLFAVAGSDGSQVRADADGPGSDRLTLLQLLGRARKAWVSRCLPETGGGPAAVPITLDVAL
jgi:hypothetical protein